MDPHKVSSQRVPSLYVHTIEPDIEKEKDEVIGTCKESGELLKCIRANPKWHSPCHQVNIIKK